MEELLGPNLFAAPGAPVSTQDALKHADLVLLYFSASWCPPCRAFTPVLKEFYLNCQKSNIKIEIIFISSDKSIQTYQTYFASMPWLSLPLSAETASISNALSSKLCINSIPTLVVLDKHGRYVTNNAKAQVAGMIGNHDDNLDACLGLVQSWKNTESVPIEEANLGVVSSIFSTFKKGYQYVTGKNEDSDSGGKQSICKKENDIDDNGENGLTSVILAFFSEASRLLQDHPNKHYRSHQLLTVQEGGGDDDDGVGGCYKIPVTLEDHRQFLLQIQLQALEDAVKEYNDTKHESAHSAAISAEQIQTSLRALGANDFSSLTSDGREPSMSVQQKLISAMSEMNDAARTAFARSVLYAENSWWRQEQRLQKNSSDNNMPDKAEEVPFMKQGGNSATIDFEITKRKLHSKKDGAEMERSVLLEFCGLCSAAVKLPEVEAYLAHGTDLFHDESHDNDDKDENNNNMSTADMNYGSNVPARVLQLQHMLLCAVGFEPTHGGMEMRKYIMKDEIQKPQSKDEMDEEVEGAFTSFLMTMQAAAKKAMDSNVNAVKEGLSDHTDGGVTRVVDVKYSEKTVTNYDSSSKGDAPSNVRMEEQSEEVQREQLKMASQAASLQRAILEEISAMDESERQEHLALARETHEAFTEKVMSLAPGPERIAFLQSVSNEQQKLLLIHKLWQAKESAA